MFKLLRLGSKVFASNFKTLKEPYKLTFAVTYKCNSRCKTCGIWKKKTKNELEIKEIEKIFENINPSWVNLTGGEPFLRDDLHEIAKTISKKNVYLLNLTTNGLLCDKIISDVKKIIKLNIPKIIVVVSLDGPKDIHEKIKGVDGSWKKSIETFKKLRKLSKENQKLQNYFGYTISSYNTGMVNQTIKAVKNEIDVNLTDFHFNIFHDSPLYYGKLEGGDIKGLQNNIQKEIDMILKGKKGINPISLLEKQYLKNIEKYFEQGKNPLKCKSLTSSCFISPNGDVYPCTIFNKKLGNLRDFNYNLKEIWKSDYANYVRKLIKENNCDGCWTPCEAYQTILGNIFNLY